MSVETERNNVSRKKNELNKLQQEYAKEQGKIAPLQKKIIDAKGAINRTKNSSTVKSKLNEIDRASKGIMDATKKSGEIQKKIGQKEKELAEAEKRLHKEEEKEDQKRQKDSERKLAAITTAINTHSSRQEQLAYELSQLKKFPKEITILFLAANPKGTDQLRLDEEARNIQEKIRLSAFRDTIKFESRWAVRPGDIFQAINETNPTIIHFSGHGSDSGELALENPDGTFKFVTPHAISQAISTVSDTVQLVVFNACYSEAQAESIIDYINASIGMTTSIGDEAACVFAAQLYSSIGFGLPLSTAFNQAVAALLLEGIQEDQTPQLFCKDGISPDSIYLVEK